MATMMHSPLPGDHFNSSPIDTPTYPTLAGIDTTIPYTDRFNDKAYINNRYSTYPSSAPPSPQLTHSSLSRGSSSLSTPASGVSLNIKDQSEDYSDDEMSFPAFEQSQKQGTYIPQPNTREEEDRAQTPVPPTDGATLPSKVNDDHAIEPEPSRHVDYLSHEWAEEDIWTSWRYIVHRRKDINNSTRLENASWRTWTKSKNKLKTVSPESLNWLKDCDVTWLYGPLQTGPKHFAVTNPTPPPSRLSHSSSFISKKPILKKRSASAAILERSRSQQSLLQRAGEIIRVQQSSPALGRPGFRQIASDFGLSAFSGSSVANTPAEQENIGLKANRSSYIFPEPPTPSDCKHVLFDEEVRQVQAVDSEEDEKHEVEEVVEESDEDDDGGLMMAPVRSRSSKAGTPRGSFSNENKTIMPLPSTTLKARNDTPEPDPKLQQNGLWPNGRILSPSSSQETLRPSRPNRNFLLDDEAELDDEDPWPAYGNANGNRSLYETEPGPGMRRTESGMFMPYDPDEEATGHSTLFGQALNAAYTLKDIAHVIWNVGWHRDKGSPRNGSRSGSPSR